jgi:hypothetical protein
MRSQNLFSFVEMKKRTYLKFGFKRTSYNWLISIHQQIAYEAHSTAFQKINLFVKHIKRIEYIYPLLMLRKHYYILK